MGLSITQSEIIPSGCILMWHGNIATIPPGWHLCDGNTGTPDLRDRFIVCAKQDSSGIAKTNISGSLTQSGGTLTHSHPFSGYTEESLANRNDLDNSGSTSYATETHQHFISSITGNNTSAIPPYYALAYIMKL